MKFDPKVRVVLGSGLGLLLSLIAGCSSTANTPPTTQNQNDVAAAPSAEERATALIAQMTLDEKLAYLGGDRDFYIRPIERLGIPEIKMADGPVGCRNWGPSTAYPASIGLAASFDLSLSHEVGNSIARDCRARGVHILLAPGTNIQRSPLNGRNFEYLGEDPFLARQHAVSFIQGVQERGVMATVKHFAANNQEWDRHHVSSEVSERALNEIYFPAFEGAVKDGKVGAVMSSYNLLNGTYASHNSFLLQKTLRDAWHFQGLVMSDWSAVYDAESAVKGGMDLEMPRGAAMAPATLKQLLQNGRITVKEIDEKVFHILRTLIHFGFFDRAQLMERPVDDPESAEVALKAARKSVVLLKNDAFPEQPLLPLTLSQLKRIAVVGPNAHPAVHGGSGSAFTVPSHVSSLLAGLRSQAPQIEVLTHPGITESTGWGGLGAPIFIEPVQQQIFLGKELSGEVVHVSQVDRINLLADGGPPAPQLPAENYSVRWTGKVKVDKVASYQVQTNADDGVRVFLDGKLVIDDFTDHAPRMSAVDLNLQAGEHKVVVEYFQGELGSICQFGFGKKLKAGERRGEQELIRLAKSVDLVIVAVGYGQSADTNSMGTAYAPYWPPEWARKAGIVEAEDDDRGFALPPVQVATIQAAARANKRTIVIGFSGGGVDFEPWLHQVPVLLWAWYPGQEGGIALAQTLFGSNNPQARLPVTFSKKYEDHPAAHSYGLRLPLHQKQARGPLPDLTACGEAKTSAPQLSHEKASRGEGPLYLSPYCEEIFVGYRGFDHAQTEPLFPFGFGLSYSSYNYSNVEAQEDGSGQIIAEVTVTNVGELAGTEVVQIYVAPLSNGAATTEPRAPQQLAGFTTIQLSPGEEKRVTVPLNSRAFALYQTKGSKGWVIPAGSYEVRASRSSRHHQVHTILKLKGRSI